MIGATITHDANLPWGWWMRTVTMPNWETVILDEEGRRWANLRDAFWAGRLNMSLHNPVVVCQGLELLLAMLASKSRDIVPHVENSVALFDGNARFYRLWTYWLVSTRLIETAPSWSPFDAKLSAEGVSVLRMLIATRSPELSAIPIGPDAATMFGEPGSAAECDRARFDAVLATHAALRKMNCAVIREDLFGQHLVEMLHRDFGDPIPMVRTIWTFVCSDAASRDRLHRWMHDRLDRWPAWCELVLKTGPHSLTQHLLELLTIGAISEPPTSGDRPTGTHIALPHGS
jgi:hypothetical protein